MSPPAMQTQHGGGRHVSLTRRGFRPPYTEGADLCVLRGYETLDCTNLRVNYIRRISMKRIIAILLVAVLAFTLIACQSGTTNSPSPSAAGQRRCEQSVSLTRPRRPLPRRLRRQRLPRQPRRRRRPAQAHPLRHRPPRRPRSALSPIWQRTTTGTENPTRSLPWR